MGIKVHFKDVQAGPGSSKEAQVDLRRVQGCSCSMRSKEVQHDSIETLKLLYKQFEGSKELTTAQERSREPLRVPNGF